MRRGAGVTNLSLMFGGSTGISIYVILLENRIEFHAHQLGATQTANNSTTVEMLGMVAGQLSTTGLPDAMQQGVAMLYLEQRRHRAIGGPRLPGRLLFPHHGGNRPSRPSIVPAAEAALNSLLTG